MPFVYPTSYEMRRLDPDYISRGRDGRLGLEIMPINTMDAAKIRWAQADNYYGLQNMRGLDGAPTRVTRPGERVYEYEPGYFGEYVDLTETELQLRAANLNFEAMPIDIADLVLNAKQFLIGRELDRIEASIWTLLTTGTLQIKIDGPTGLQAQVYNDTYNFQSFSAIFPWSNFGSATPLLNFQSVQQLGVGHSVDFGAGATAYMNRVTANRLLNNTNAADYAGRRNSYGATINDIPGVVSFLQAQGLPKIVTYDEGYYPQIGNYYNPIPNVAGWTNPAKNFQKFIPDGVVVVVGKRARGQRIGEYQIVRNASNGFKPGSYEYVIDRSNGVNGEKRTPANIEIHRGHNGGPTIEYPSAVAVMTV